jgi:hypothetical protein
MGRSGNFLSREREQAIRQAIIFLLCRHVSYETSAKDSCKKIVLNSVMVQEFHCL